MVDLMYVWGVLDWRKEILRVLHVDFSAFIERLELSLELLKDGLILADDVT